MGKISIINCKLRVLSNCRVFYLSRILDSNRPTVFENKIRNLLANKVESLFEIVPKINKKNSMKLDVEDKA